ncbi:MAG: 1-deoxy-D-xylulose-5-phosphate reductoisomerase [Nitrospiraceae bacterium]|nr:1-deoxy-D-xylulose-5-phosphate reductoisomerase [Nitrospiraceae bacterium]
MKKIAILGSTGSIGTSALEVIEKYPGLFRVTALAASRNHGLLLEQIKKFRPEIVALHDSGSASLLRGRTDVPVYEGREGLDKVASYPGADFVISSIVGFAGLRPTLAAIRAGKDIGLANKEVLVTAGDIVMAEARRHGVRMLPIDSEHSAIFQCLEGRGRESVKNIVLTASGGPFKGKTRKELETVNAGDALRHPNWQMGRKITVDSATLMNKGLEVIEAHHLFSAGQEHIKVLIHPQSIIHSMVEFIDGSLLAQLSVPDMKAPIAYALSYPQRLDEVIPRLDLVKTGSLSFQEPDMETFPCLAYAYEALVEGGTVPAVLNASNEIAVDAFLNGRIGFNDIPVIIKKAMESHKKQELRDENTVLEADALARRSALRLVEDMAKKPIKER